MIEAEEVARSSGLGSEADAGGSVREGGWRREARTREAGRARRQFQYDETSEGKRRGRTACSAAPSEQRQPNHALVDQDRELLAPSHQLAHRVAHVPPDEPLAPQCDLRRVRVVLVRRRAGREREERAREVDEDAGALGAQAQLVGARDEGEERVERGGGGGAVGGGRREAENGERVRHCGFNVSFGAGRGERGHRDALLPVTRCLSRPMTAPCSGCTMSSSRRRSSAAGEMTPVLPRTSRLAAARGIRPPQSARSTRRGYEDLRDRARDAPGIAKCRSRLTTPNRIWVVSPGRPVRPIAPLTRSETMRASGSARA